MKGNDLITKVDQIWAKVSKLYLDAKEEEILSDAELELLYTLVYQCKAICSILKERPF